MLYAIASLTGITITMPELLGRRIVGPCYGVSLYVWSPLLAVTIKTGVRFHYPRPMRPRHRM